jgi:hypothetical protein
MKRVIRKSEDLPERAAGFVEPAASLPSWIIGDRMILWIQRDIPGSATLMGSFLRRSRQFFGSGLLASTLHLFLRIWRIEMVLQERVVTKMMLLWIKDWDSFQRVMRYWRRGLI